MRACQAFWQQAGEVNETLDPGTATDRQKPIKVGRPAETTSLDPPVKTMGIGQLKKKALFACTRAPRKGYSPLREKL